AQPDTAAASSRTRAHFGMLKAIDPNPAPFLSGNARTVASGRRICNRGRIGERCMAAQVFIILFRGVGGKTQLPVGPLREALEAAGFDDVATYINSGNVVLKSRLPRKEVVAKVAEICARAFGFDKT